MNRTINVFRRRPNIVDMMVPLTPGVVEYRLKWAQNFDVAAPWTTIIQAKNSGFYDDTIDRGKIDSQPSTGTSVRMTFNPVTFSIDDTKSFWIQLWHYDGAAETQVSGCSLLLPESAHHGVGIVTIKGDAPSAISSAGALQLDLPRLSQDFRIENEEAAGGPTLYISTEQDGPEQAVPPAPAAQYTGFLGTQGSLWVRGSAATTFSAIFTTSFPR